MASGEKLHTGIFYLALIPPKLHFMPLDSSIFLLIFFFWLKMEILLPVAQGT